jgi:hypothetical protein
MPKLEFALARGGRFTATVLVDKAPQTWAAIRPMLPLTLKAYNARWSGRETHTAINVPNKPPRENQALHCGPGDVIYACERPDDRQYTGFEAIGWFYGAERVRDWRGSFPVNVFARVAEAEWSILEEVGRRTWREGGEDCQISILSD